MQHPSLEPIRVGADLFQGQPWQMCYRVVIRKSDGRLAPIRQRFRGGFVADSLAGAVRMRAQLIELRSFANAGLDLVICEWPERALERFRSLALE